MNNLPESISKGDQFDLKLRINVIKAEIEKVKLELNEFEAILRNFVLEDMILEQELAAKYRNFQKAKKAKRLEQKRKGKTYKEPEGLIVSKKVVVNEEQEENRVLLKKLYRDAMMLVHPDRVGDSVEEKENATELTSKLVDIYNQGDLNELQLFYGLISEQVCGENLEGDTIIENNASSEYYENELMKLERQLSKLKSKHTYKVLSTYKRPIDFAQELKDYYKDRIEKLKKRTRKVQ